MGPLPGYRYWLGELDKNEGGLENFAEGYKIFGFIREKGQSCIDSCKPQPALLLCTLKCCCPKPAESAVAPHDHKHHHHLHRQQGHHGPQNPLLIIKAPIYYT